MPTVNMKGRHKIQAKQARNTHQPRGLSSEKPIGGPAIVHHLQGKPRHQMDGRIGGQKRQAQVFGELVHANAQAQGGVMPGPSAKAVR